MRVILLASAVAALAAPAFAAPWTATPSKPAHENGFAGQEVIWNCDASGCTTQSDTSNADPRIECLVLAREIGALTSFTGDKPLSAAQLAECNKSAGR